MEKILIVDQDEINLLVIEMVLKEIGYDVATITSFGNCINELSSKQYELLLLGLDVSQKNSFKLVEKIRANPDISEVKIIFLVSNNVKVDIANAYRLGALDFIKKPTLPEEIIQKVRDAIRKKKKDTILVVDDEPANLLTFNNLLGIGYNVKTASSGREALDMIREKRPDLLLLDLHMPEMDGFQVMNYLSEIDECENLPVIVVTADDDLDTAAELFQAGAMDYLSKPLVMQIAIQRIRRIIELTHLQRDLKAEVKQKNKELMLTNKRLQSLSDQTIFALAVAIDAKDSYTNGHSRRVAQYAREIAKRMGKTLSEQKDIFNVALLHDVGKIAIPEGIIDKPGKLTPVEYEIIKSHTTRGYDILKTISVMPMLYIGARWHHERFDGNGYPDGKKGTEIPEIARIICVADCYDAMSSDRSYRKALPQETVRGEIENGLGTQFDPEIGRIMLEMIDEDTEYKMRSKVDR
jgi:putative two-component system response regulator